VAGPGAAVMEEVAPGPKPPEPRHWCLGTPTTAPEPQPAGAPQPTPSPPTGPAAEPQLPITRPGEPGTPVQPAGGPTHKRYIVELPNRSLRDPAARESVWKLIRELAKVVDPAHDQLRHELLSLRIELNTIEGHQGSLETRAAEVGARVRVEEDEF
jgi:hypothetical protein